MIPCPEKSTGTTSDGTSVPQQQAPMGWVCPVCGRGNAPWAMTCIACRPSGHWHIPAQWVVTAK